MNRDRNTPDTPIDDVGQALQRLFNERRANAWLHTRESGPPRIVRDFFGGHYDIWSGSDTYYVTERVVNELKNRGYVDGRKHWGYTDQNQCRLNSRGEEILAEQWEKDRIVREIMES